MKIKRGSTSVRRLIFIADSTSTTGAGLTGLVYNSAGLAAYYFAGDLADDVLISLATATLGTWTSGGFVQVDATNMPGWYEVGIPNEALNGGNEVAIQFRGATNMVPVNIYVELDTVDYQTDAFGSLKPTTAGRTLDVSAGGEAGIDWANVGSPTTTIDLSGTTIKTATDVETDTADIQSRLPAALVSGRIDTSVGAMAAGVITASSIAADAITDAKVASDVTIASVTGAVGSVTGNVGGNVTGSVGSVVGLTASNLDAAVSTLATAANLATVAGYLDTEIAAIKAKTDQFVFTVANQVDANALSGGGSATVTVVPLTGVVEGRVDGTSINVFTQETCTISIAVVDAEGNSVTVTGLTLEIVIESRLMTDVVVIADGSITKSGSTISFAIPSSVSATEGAYQWALRKTTDDSVLLQGPLIVSYAPQGD